MPVSLCSPLSNSNYSIHLLNSLDNLPSSFPPFVCGPHTFFHFLLPSYILPLLFPPSVLLFISSSFSPSPILFSHSLLLDFSSSFLFFVVHNDFPFFSFLIFLIFIFDIFFYSYKYIKKLEFCLFFFFSVLIYNFKTNS